MIEKSVELVDHLRFDPVITHAIDGDDRTFDFTESLVQMLQIIASRGKAPASARRSSSG